MSIPAAASDIGPDHLSQRNFQRLATFIEGYSGIKMPATKVTMIEGRLRRRLRATGMADLKQYCDFLFEKNGLASEGIHLIDVMTTNKTEFFREPDHFSSHWMSRCREWTASPSCAN
jgi:chemotaxis protein methyltransferase CheR